MLKKFKTAGWGLAAVYITAFVLMLILNIITPIYADDYSYVFSFKTGERIESIPDIFVSLEQHALTCNGRLVSHFFVHLFMMLPQVVFDVVNAGVFTLFIFLSARIANVKKERNNYLDALILIFTLLCHNAFGQEMLWVAGACNYLWAMTAGLAFLLPFHEYTVHEKKMRPAFWPLFILYGFIVGAFLENVSAAVIGTAFLYVAAAKFLLKRKFRVEQILSIITAAAGYLFMITQPGTLLNKVSKGFEFLNTLAVAGVIVGMLAALAVPAALYVFLFRKARREGVDGAVIISSLIFVIGGMASNLILIVAAYYPMRCSIGLSSMLIVAVAMLYSAVGNVDFGKYTKKLVVSFVCVFALFFTTGVADIISTRAQFNINEAHIEECKEQGILDVEVNKIVPVTKYSAARGMTHLSDNPRDWPNGIIAKYYELNSITLKKDA